MSECRPDAGGGARPVPRSSRPRDSTRGRAASRRARLHGHAHRPLPDARPRARRRPHHPQRRRARHRRRDPLAERLPAPARDRGDRRRHARGLRPARRVGGRLRGRSWPRDGVLPSWRLGAFDDLEETLRHSLARLRSSPELVAPRPHPRLRLRPRDRRRCATSRGPRSAARAAAPWTTRYLGRSSPAAWMRPSSPLSTEKANLPSSSPLIRRAVAGTRSGALKRIAIR